ncbi:hypothetical protein [Sphingomonas albertensis]|uniref:hypothetical protein n=1 Tax=Sphingomonas albertensis TaxID=2762591 RepID=UPI0037D9C4E4
MTDWKPISELPDDATDGRQFLFWWYDEAVIAAYNDMFQSWYIPYYEMGSVELPDFSYFAVITSPKTN